MTRIKMDSRRFMEERFKNMDVNNAVNASNINNYTASANYANGVNTPLAAYNADESVSAAGVSVTVSVSEAETEQKAEETAAVYEPTDAAAKTYQPDTEKIKQLWAENDQKLGTFRNLVETLLNKQAQKYDIANNWLKDVWAKAQQTEQQNMVEIDEETRAAASKEIEEGGYYSVDETAKRLLDFAVALSGGDPATVDTLRGAVEDGFKAVEDMWGGELPEISQQTYDAVMKGFDEWKEAGDASAISLLKKETDGAGTLGQVK